MTWSEVQGDVWVIPARRTKNGQEHGVPLSPAAQTVLASLPRLPSPFVFTTNARNPVSGFSDARDRLQKLMEDEAGGPVPHFRIHDLRRTMATVMARLGVSVEVCEKCLNHKGGTFGGIVGVYQRHSYGAEMRSAFERWASFVITLDAEPTSASVVPLMMRG